jgi:hypothetical protein
MRSSKRTLNRNVSTPETLSLLATRFEPIEKLAQALNQVGDLKYSDSEPLMVYLDKARWNAFRGGLSEEVLLSLVYKNIPTEVQSKIALMRQNNPITWEMICYVTRLYDEIAKPTVFPFNKILLQ